MSASKSWDFHWKYLLLKLIHPLSRILTCNRVSIMHIDISMFELVIQSKRWFYYACKNKSRTWNKIFFVRNSLSEGESKNLNFIKTLRAISLASVVLREVPICEWQRIRVRYIRHSTAWKAEIDQVIICSARSTIMYIIRHEMRALYFLWISLFTHRHDQYLLPRDIIIITSFEFIFYLFFA